MASQTVENYLKCIFSLEKEGKKGVSTNAIAERLETQAPSVTDMLKKLSAKGLVNYKKYQGASLTEEGRRIAVDIIRRHRLWEVFLVEKLDFGWDEVHEVAEELEHIESDQLIKRLDAFLGHPELDPHGDPIPDAEGIFRDKRKKVSVLSMEKGMSGVVVGVNDTSVEFLQYLDSIGLALGYRIEVLERYSFDQSMKIQAESQELQISQQVARNLLILQS